MAAFSENAASRTQKSPRNGAESPHPAAVQAAADDLRNDRRVEQDQSQRGLEQQLHLNAGQAEHFPGKECRAGAKDHAHKDPEQIGRVAEKLDIHRREPPQNAGRALFTVGAGQRQQGAQDPAQNDTQHREDRQLPGAALVTHTGKNCAENRLQTVCAD